MLKLKYLLIGVAGIIVDCFVYVLFGLMLMRYDDTYEENRGDYWQWGTLNAWDKFAIVGIHVWNAINIVMVIYIIYRIYKWYGYRIANTL